MKKCVFSTLLLAFFFTSMYAQRFSVFALEGKAYTIKDGKRIELIKRDLLNNESTIVLLPQSRILLIDKKKKKKHEIPGPKEGKVQNLIKEKDVSSGKLFAELINYIFGKCSDDYGSKDDEGRYKVNANSKRSLSDQENGTLTVFDKVVQEMMDQFYK